jgi:predicted nicotinamide N-methyase
MLSYLEYENNEEDERCLVNIFGRSSSSSSDENDQNIKKLAEIEADEETERAEQAIPHNPITTYQLADRNIQVEIETNRIKGIAHQLWPASYLLCQYLETNLLELINNPFETEIIELGAGVGLSGIVLGILGCQKVTITDLPEALELITKNIERNQSLFPSHVTISSKILRWGVQEDYHFFENSSKKLFVLAADCVYWEHLYDPFFRTLEYYITTHDATVILAHYKRWKKEKKFFTLCSRSFSVSVVYENIEMVPMTDEHVDLSASSSFSSASALDARKKKDDKDEEEVIEAGAVVSSSVTMNEKKVPMRKQISRIYLMKRK